jgi:hypothetical protein
MWSRAMSASFPMIIPKTTTGLGRRCCPRRLCHRKTFTPCRLTAHPTRPPRTTSRRCRRSHGATLLDPARPLFYIILVRLGPDAHTASLLPGEMVLEECKRWVAAAWAARGSHHHDLSGDREQPVCRISGGGTGKGNDVQRDSRGWQQCAAARVKPVGERIWFVDQGAPKPMATSQASHARCANRRCRGLR